MSDALKPHYVKIHQRSGWEVLRDGRRANDQPLPLKFKDWFAANDYANQNSDQLIKIFPYLPEYAALERAYLQKSMNLAEQRFERELALLQEAHNKLCLDLKARIDELDVAYPATIS